MNRVYMSGKLKDQPILRMEGQTPHLILTLSVTHKKRTGELQREDYRINAWNRIAQWGMAHLERGQILALQGYLTQNASNNHATEVTVDEFLPMRVSRSEQAFQQINVNHTLPADAEPGISKELVTEESF